MILIFQKMTPVALLRLYFYEIRKEEDLLGSICLSRQEMVLVRTRVIVKEVGISICFEGRVNRKTRLNITYNRERS